MGIGLVNGNVPFFYAFSHFLYSNVKIEEKPSRTGNNGDGRLCNLYMCRKYGAVFVVYAQITS